MDMIVICGAAIMTAVLAVMLRQQSPHSALLLSLASGAVIILSILKNIPDPSLGSASTLIRQRHRYTEYRCSIKSGRYLLCDGIHLRLCDGSRLALAEYEYLLRGQDTGTLDRSAAVPKYLNYHHVDPELK